MWFSMIFLKSRDVKTWRRTSKLGSLAEAEFYNERFATNQKSLPTSGSKVMAHYVIFTKVVTLTLIFIRFSPKKLPGSLELNTSAVNFQKDRTDWCGLYIVQLRTDKQTDKQTDRQTDKPTNILCKNLRFCKVTNRGDQYTLQKSTILQSNERIIGDLTFYIDFDWHWPLTLTPWPLTLTLTVIYFCKNLMLWRRVTQNGASCIRMEITLR